MRPVTWRNLARASRSVFGSPRSWIYAEMCVAPYFETLAAPSKDVLWFERPGHGPFVDEAAKFNAALVDLVRPRAASDLRRTGVA